MAFVITKNELRHVLIEQGFTIELWDKPIGTIGGVERQVQSRRCFGFKQLMGELDNLHSINVSTIGLYKVFPTDSLLENAIGVYIRWAYIVGR